MWLRRRIGSSIDSKGLGALADTKIPAVPSEKHNCCGAQVGLRVSWAQIQQGDVHPGIFISAHTLDGSHKEMRQWLTEFADKGNPK